jgi:hypothetical protein
MSAFGNAEKSLHVLPLLSVNADLLVSLLEAKAALAGLLEAAEGLVGDHHEATIAADAALAKIDKDFEAARAKVIAFAI